MLVCCWFDLGLKLLKVENGTFENRTIAGNSHYLVPFGNRTIAGTALIETALTGDPLYYIKNQRGFFLENNKWECLLITEARCEQSCYTNNLICSFERKIKMKKQLESSKLQSFTSKSMSMINLNSNLIWH